MMEFSLLNLGLAGGAALAILPVILHLLQRQAPKRVIFPALQLMRERTKKTTKKLKIKNWLLLLARMLLIALMALALARPTVNSQAILGEGEAPTAFALIFDTSLSMGYKEAGKTRLELAKESALKLLAKANTASQIYVIDSAEPAEPPGLTPTAASRRIQELLPQSANRSLNESIGPAFAAISQSDRPRREVFVFTDLAQSSWDLGRPLTEKQKQIQKEKGISIYVLRLNPEKPVNTAIVESKTTSEIISAETQVPIQVVIRHRGPETSQLVEFYLDGEKRGEKTIVLQADSETPVTFSTPKIPMGVHQSKIQITGGDPLEFDDVHYLTFRAQKALKVLIISDLLVDANFLRSALDPEQALKTDTRVFHADIRLTSENLPPDELLQTYSVVFMNNVAKLPEDSWARLTAYVRQGGGLVVGLGQASQIASYNSPLATALLPAKLVQIEIPKNGTTFSKADQSHPIFDPQYFKEVTTELVYSPIRRYYSVEPATEAGIPLFYKEGAPALLDRGFEGLGAGRCLMWTTSLSRRANDRDPNAWNEFPLSWTFVYLMDRIASQLAGASAERWNHESGNVVLVSMGKDAKPKEFQLVGPEGKTLNQIQTPTAGNILTVVGANQPGNWVLNPSEDTSVKLGFSVNPNPKESELTVATLEELQTLLGKERFALAQGPEDLERATAEQRIGQELFPWLMLLILILITAENYIANTFYRSKPLVPTKPTT